MLLLSNLIIISPFQEDVSLEGYDRHCISAAAPGPLSREEEEREEVRVAQSHVAVGVDAKHQVNISW